MLPHQRVGWGGTGTWEGAQLGLVTLCSAVKPGAKEEEGGDFGDKAFVFPSNL